MTIKIDRKQVLKLLIDRDMTARDLARKTGISEPTMYNVLNGAGFSSQTLGKMAEVLAVEPGSIITVEHDEPQLQPEA